MKALLLIDFQRGFRDSRWGARNNPEAEARALELLARWRAAAVPIFHVRHLSTEPGSPLGPGEGAAFLEGFEPCSGEALVEKRVNSAFIGTDLEARLRAAGATALAVAGLTTPHCVSTSVRMAANLGFAVQLAHDACAAFAANARASWRGASEHDAEAVHRAAVDHLHGEFAEAVAAEGLHP